MSIEKWRGPVKNGVYLGLGLFMAIYLSVVAYVTYPFEGVDLTIGLVMFSPLAMFLGPMAALSWFGYRSVWTHISLTVYKDFEKVWGAIGAVLDDYSVTGPHRVWYLRRDRVTLRKGEVIVMVERMNPWITCIYVGPTGEPTRDEVSRLKGVIEANLDAATSSRGQG